MSSLLAGISGKIENSGTSCETVCPVCHHTTRMRQFWIYDRVHVCCVPVAHLNKQCLVLCPLCASVFELEETAARAYQNKNASFIAEPWLTLLKAGRPNPEAEPPRADEPEQQ